MANERHHQEIRWMAQSTSSTPGLKSSETTTTPPPTPTATTNKSTTTTHEDASQGSRRTRDTDQQPGPRSTDTRDRTDETSTEVSTTTATPTAIPTATPISSTSSAPAHSFADAVWGSMLTVGGGGAGVASELVNHYANSATNQPHYVALTNSKESAIVNVDNSTGQAHANGVAYLQQASGCVDTTNQIHSSSTGFQIHSSNTQMMMIIDHPTSGHLAHDQQHHHHQQQHLHQQHLSIGNGAQLPNQYDNQHDNDNDSDNGSQAPGHQNVNQQHHHPFDGHSNGDMKTETTTIGGHDLKATGSPPPAPGAPR